MTARELLMGIIYSPKMMANPEGRKILINAQGHLDYAFISALKHLSEYEQRFYMKQRLYYSSVIPIMGQTCWSCGNDLKVEPEGKGRCKGCGKQLCEMCLPLCDLCIEKRDEKR